jgi:hypothetical protein
MMSMQELYYRKMYGDGGLGYQYHKRFIGGALSQQSQNTWNPTQYSSYTYDSWVPESTVVGFDPYPIGINEQGNELYNEYTPEDMKYFTTMKDVKNILKEPLPEKLLKNVPEINIGKLPPKNPKEIKLYKQQKAKTEKEQKEKEIQFNERQEQIKIIKSQLNKLEEELDKRRKTIIAENAKSKKEEKGFKSKTLKDIIEKISPEIEQKIDNDTEIKRLIAEIIKLEKDIYDIEMTTEELIFKPEYHERLLGEREDLTPENEELFNDIMYDEIPDIDETFNTWNDDTYIEGILPLYAEIEEHPKPDALSFETIETLAKTLGVDGGEVFEDLDNYPDNLLLNIIKTLDPSFNDKNISEIIKINSNKDYDDGEFKFKGTDWAPLDNIVIIKRNNGIMDKYIIENKYYDKTSIYTGEKGKRGKVTKGSDVTFSEILDYNTRHFNDYKKIISGNFDPIMKEYNEHINNGLDDEVIKEIEPELHKQYHYYLDMFKDNNKLTESFYRDVYLPNIPMKLSKTNFQYKYAKPTEGGVTKPDFYDYFHNDAKLRGQTRTKFNNNGIIEGIYNSQGNNLSSNIGYDLYKGGKVLYLVSFKDALLGMNWSKTLSTLGSKHKSFFEDPLHLRHPTQSAYGSHTTSTGRSRRFTDSLSLRPTDFIVLNGKI